MLEKAEELGILCDGNEKELKRVSLRKQVAHRNAIIISLKLLL